MSRPRAFTIMSRSQRQQGIYDAVIKPTFEEDLKWECRHIDELPGAGNVVSRIVKEIAAATLVVADLTLLEPDVLYELGIAHSLGNNVLTLIRRGETVPFDLRSYRTIEYEDSAAGARRLSRDLNAAVQTLPDWGAGPTNPVQDFLPPERRMGAPITAVPLPATPTDEEMLRESAYTRELAAKVRQRLHFVQIAQLQSPDPGLAVEAAELERRLQELRERIRGLAAH